MVVDLPLELEREIFEWAARESLTIARRLVFVAHRVKAWVDPILYESVTLYDRSNAVQFLSTAEAKPSHISYVKRLCIHCNVGYWQARRVLALCPELDNLSCWISEPRLRPFLANQRLGGLSFMLSGLAYDAEDSPPDFTNIFYSRVTHLHFTDRWVSWVTWTGFHVLPKLTHIAFLYDITSISDDTKVTNAISDILSTCPSLILCALIYTHSLSSKFDSIEDPRFVAVHVPQAAFGKGEDLLRRKTDIWGKATEGRRKRSGACAVQQASRS
ncbi:hypothetical protein BDZ94DRAFT_1178124 [Collybia nuda]|uniref:Uncharacterized protein n=1 Tax=Collybia nuda TaxID=64659 RepID=A0A9P5XTG6_9AGAR|nr:hypothetical protein BDZ94DRAFT_1178124 [Collybia nuda]